jgi:large subunit ribosomal protein L6
MSKIGRKPIDITGVKVELKNHSLHYKGAKDSGVYELPEALNVEIMDHALKLVSTEKNRDINRIWGLHRALLSNKIKGAQEEFVYKLQIVGLGFKAKQVGSKLEFSLGYSHKIDFDLPKEVTVAIDKTGQQLTFKSADKELLGLVCSKIRALREPEPYKGTGIKYENEVIFRKAGKTKGA